MLTNFNNVLLDHSAVSSISTNDFKTIVLDSLNLLKNKLETLDSEVSKLKSFYVNVDKKLANLDNKSSFISSAAPKNSPYAAATLLDAQTEYENFVSELKSNYKLDINNDYKIPNFSNNTSYFKKTPKTFLPKRKKLGLNKRLKNKTLKKS